MMTEEQIVEWFHRLQKSNLNREGLCIIVGCCIGTIAGILDGFGMSEEAILEAQLIKCLHIHKKDSN